MFENVITWRLTAIMGRRGPIPSAAFTNLQKPASGIGEVPAYVPKAARIYYDTIAQLLHDRLDIEDNHVVAHAAVALYEIALATLQLENNGYVAEKQQGETLSPWVHVRRLALKEYQIASAKLGLSPADRHRLVGAIAAQEQSGGPSDFDKEHGSDSA